MAQKKRQALAVPELIVRKREGGKLAEQEIRDLVAGFMDGSVTDYQMSALAMAIYFRGMTFDETVAMTLAMRDSGSVLEWPGLDGPALDKHSIGGVGDLVSLVLGPVLAACGAYVPMISGRGLGHTGGTLDKIESIPGYRTDLTTEEFLTQLKDVGIVLTGQSLDLAQSTEDSTLWENTLALTTIGPCPQAEYGPELTGTGKGEWFGYFPGVGSTFVAKLNKLSGQIDNQQP